MIISALMDISQYQNYKIRSSYHILALSSNGNFYICKTTDKNLKSSALKLHAHNLDRLIWTQESPYFPSRLACPWRIRINHFMSKNKRKRLPAKYNKTILELSK